MKVFRSLSLYTFVGFLNAGVGFLVLPILTHYLSPEDYGIISLVNTYVLILMPILGLSASSLISVEYYNKKITKDEFPKLFSSVRLVPLLMMIPILIIFIAGYKILPPLLELPFKAYCILLPLTLFALYQDNFKSFLITSKRTGLFSITTLGKLIIEIPLTIFFITYIQMHWDGRIYAWLITVMFFTFLSIYFYRRWNLLSFSISTNYIKQAVIFGTPLILHQIGKFVINQSDRLFLAKMISIKEMGIYSVGYQVGMIILIIVTAFGNFFSPFLYEKLNENTFKNKIEIIRVSYGFIAAIFIILAVLTFLTPSFFTYLVSPEFAGAAKYVFWIGLGYCFWGVYIVFTNYIFYLKKSKILAYISIFNVAVNLSCNYFFIKWFGAIGAAYATCISFFLVCIIIAYTANKLYPMPWMDFKHIFSREPLTER